MLLKCFSSVNNIQEYIHLASGEDYVENHRQCLSDANFPVTITSRNSELFECFMALLRILNKSVFT